MNIRECFYEGEYGRCIVLQRLHYSMIICQVIQSLLISNIFFNSMNLLFNCFSSNLLEKMALFGHLEIFK